jgi:hypothetical protein
VAVVRCFAGLGLGADTRTGLTSVNLGAGIAVVAHHAVVDRLDQALVGLRIVHGLEAGPQVVLAGLVATSANTGQTSVFAGERVAVVAAVPVRPSAHFTFVALAADNLADSQLRGIAVIVGSTLDGAVFGGRFAAARGGQGRQHRRHGQRSPHVSKALEPPSNQPGTPHLR